MSRHSAASKSVQRDGTLSAPYAPRNSRARIATDYPGPMKKSMACRQPYFSLSDPHLQEYFARKGSSVSPLRSPVRPRSVGAVHKQQQQQQFLKRRKTAPSYSLKKSTQSVSTPHGKQGSTASLDYPVQVGTGDVKGGGTDAAVFVTLCGSRGCSAKTRLLGEFDRGSVVSAHVTSADIGKLEKVVIEHDNSGFHSDWFLDKVVVGGGKQAKTFPCSQWLSRSEGDGEIKRTLTRMTKATPTPSHMTYSVSIQTGHMRGAGTDANVFISLHGDKARTPERRLDNDPANFERGRCDVFKVRSAGLGDVENVVLRHDNSGVGPGWYVEWVEVRCVGGEGVRHFPCGRWLDASESGALQCELTPAAKEDSSTSKTQGCCYSLEVTTGSCPGAGTTANVYVQLHGNGSSSGRVWLQGSGRGFRAGQTDSFDVLSPCLVSPLETITVGHDNKGSEPGWFLEKVVVCSSEGGERWVCECGRWLSMDSGDGRIERELHPTPLQEEVGVASGEWLVAITTSDLRGAGTDANVSIQMHGSLADSTPFSLGGGGPEHFERGEVDMFPLPLGGQQLGEVEAVSLSHDGSGPYPNWHVERLTLEQPTSGKAYTFTCNRWLSAEHGLSARLSPVRSPGPITTLTPSHTPVTTLTLSHTTVTALTPSHTTVTETQASSEGGNPFGSQTTPSRQATPTLAPPTLSSAAKEKMEPGALSPTITSNLLRMDEQSGEEEDSSCLHPSPSIAPRIPDTHTLPYTVHVKATPSPPHSVNPHTITLPHCELTLLGDKGTSQPIRLESLCCHSYMDGKPEIFSIEVEDVGSISAITFMLVDSRADALKWVVDEVTVHSPTSGHTYCFPWGRGMDSWRGYTVQGVELMSSGSTSLGLSKTSGSMSAPALQTAFEVKIMTADKKHAGTTNDVTLIFQGTRGNSKEFHIKNPSRGALFQRGQSDRLQVGLPCGLGGVASVRVAHWCRDPRRRNKDMDSSKWFLFQLVLTNLADKTRSYFLCRQWIAESSREDLRFVDVPLRTSPQ